MEEKKVKIAEWIRGSKISWTDAFDKSSISYGNNQGKSIDYWHSFIKQYHVSSLIQLELKSMIKNNGHYAVQGVYYSLPKGRKLVEDDDTLYCYHHLTALAPVQFTHQIHQDAHLVQ